MSGDLGGYSILLIRGGRLMSFSPFFVFAIGESRQVVKAQKTLEATDLHTFRSPEISLLFELATKH